MAHEVNQETLAGMWAGLPVPWTDDDRVDEARLRVAVRQCAEAGVPGFYTCGTTGEFYALDDDEWERVNRATIEEAHACDKPVEVGVTDACTPRLLRKVERAVAIGGDAIQLALPFWQAMSDEEVVRLFSQINAIAPGFPTLIYDTPRQKRNLSIEMYERIHDVAPGLAGSKFARPDVCQLDMYVRRLPWMNFMATENVLVDAMMRGATGCHSALVYMCPKTMLRYFELCLAQEWTEALKIQSVITRLFFEGLTDLEAHGCDDAAGDHALACTGGFIDVGLRVRPPYVAATPELVTSLREWCRKNTPELLHET